MEMLRNETFFFNPRFDGDKYVLQELPANPTYTKITGRWDYGLFFSPQQELPTIGSSYAYDGKDNIYFSVVVVNTVVRIFKYNLQTNVVSGAFTTTQWEGTATAGNLMEIIEIDGDWWLYILQHTGVIWQRALIFDDAPSGQYSLSDARFVGGL
jgi:hypothetical protein